MGFPQGFMDELLSKTDILELIRSHTQIQRRGTRWLARCPFHNEKTPSFNITPEKGMFYCFGCGAGGTALQFVMRAENLAYADAVAYLASRANMPLPAQDDSRRRYNRERLLTLMRTAARFYYDQLSTPAAAHARAYMEARGIRPDAARRFGLGFAPDAWDGLSSALYAGGFTPDELHTAGLIARRQNGGHYDAFRNRLMFPIFNLTGQVIAFSGRALDDSPAKYKNSPETPLYQKRGTLYAAQLARKSKRPFWILCEGNMDALMLHQHGYDNAIASCGTALTDLQARLIARHTGELVLCYDGDTAGQKAADKAIDILDSAGLKVRVLHLDNAKDPDEFLQKHGAAAFDRLLEGSTNHIEYRLSLLEGKHNLDNDAGKVDYLKAATALLAALGGQAQRQVYAHRVANRLGIAAAAVAGDVEAVRKKRVTAAAKEAQSRILRPYGNAADPAEEQMLSLVLAQPELLTDSRLTAEHFTAADTKALFALLSEGVSPFTADLPPEQSALAARLAAYPLLTDLSGAARAFRAGEEKLLRITEEKTAAAGDPDQALLRLYELRKQQTQHKREGI